MPKKGAPAKAKSESTPNKAEAIKAVLAKGIDNPTQVVEAVKKQYGLEVPTQYVSNIKQQLKAKDAPVKAAPAKAPAPAAPAPVKAPVAKSAPSDKLDTAIEFCAGVGGVDEAKALLAKIERIRKL